MKRIILMCFMVLIVSFFAGCSEDSSVEPESSTQTSVDKTTSTWTETVFEDQDIELLGKLGSRTQYWDYYGFTTSNYSYDAIRLQFDFTIDDEPDEIKFYVRGSEVDARDAGDDTWFIEEGEFEYGETYDVLVRIYYSGTHKETTCGTWTCVGFHG